MLNTYQVFKIVMGLVAAAFILAASLQIAGVYSQSQQGVRSAAALATLLSTAGDVQRTGNPASLSGLPSFTVDSAGILAGPDRSAIPFAFLVVPGPSLLLSSQHLDLGWWDFRAASASPQMTFAFAFESADPRLLSTARSLLSALPDSEGFEPKSQFALCQGAALSAQDCGPPCERASFRPLLSSINALSACTAPLPANDRLITFASACTPGQGLCVEPAQDNGLIPVVSSGQRLFAKDPLDLAALALSASPGPTRSAADTTLFDLKNQRFSAELALAARARAAQARLLADRLDAAVARNDLAQGSDAAACPAGYRAFAAALDPLPALLSASQWWRTEAGAAAVVTQFRAVHDSYAQLSTGGCSL